MKDDVKRIFAITGAVLGILTASSIAVLLIYNFDMYLQGYMPPVVNPKSLMMLITGVVIGGFAFFFHGFSVQTRYRILALWSFSGFVTAATLAFTTLDAQTVGYEFGFAILLVGSLCALLGTLFVLKAKAATPRARISTSS